MNTNEFVNADQVLHDEWLASYGKPDIDFIYDGATDPEKWLSSPCRIMCLLKEAHGGGQWNHAKGILDHKGLLRVEGGANQATHYRMIEWMYAIEATLMGTPCDVEGDRLKDYPKARLTMLRSAWVNIKKADGVPYSDGGDLYAVAKRDAAFLRRQMALLNPKIVLCGSTFGIVRDVLFPDAQRITGTDFSYRTHGGRIILDHNHPSRKERDSYKKLIAEVEKFRANPVTGPELAPDGEPPGAGDAGSRLSPAPDSAAGGPDPRR